MPMVSAKQLVGRRIVGFAPRPSPDGPKLPGGKHTCIHQPVIELDDGSRLVFQTEESENGTHYGTLIIRVKPAKVSKDNARSG